MLRISNELVPFPIPKKSEAMRKSEYRHRLFLFATKWRLKGNIIHIPENRHSRRSVGSYAYCSVWYQMIGRSCSSNILDSDLETIHSEFFLGHLLFREFWRFSSIIPDKYLVVFLLGHCYFIPKPFQFFIHDLSYDSNDRMGDEMKNGEQYGV
jgi:hypothetical protein